MAAFEYIADYLTTSLEDAEAEFGRVQQLQSQFLITQLLLLLLSTSSAAVANKKTL